MKHTYVTLGGGNLCDVTFHVYLLPPDQLARKIGSDAQVLWFRSMRRVINQRVVFLCLLWLFG